MSRKLGSLLCMSFSMAFQYWRGGILVYNLYSQLLIVVLCIGMTLAIIQLRKTLKISLNC